MQDVCDLHLLFYLLIRIDEFSLLLLGSEVSTAFQTESWAPYLYVRIGDSTTVPWSSLRASLLSIYNSVGPLDRHWLFINLVWLCHHCTSQEHEGTFVLKYCHKEGEYRHDCTEETTQLAQVVWNAINRAFEQNFCLAYFKSDWIQKPVIVRNSSDLLLLYFETFLYFTWANEAKRAVD